MGWVFCKGCDALGGSENDVFRVDLCEAFSHLDLSGLWFMVGVNMCEQSFNQYLDSRLWSDALVALI